MPDDFKLFANDWIKRLLPAIIVGAACYIGFRVETQKDLQSLNDWRVEIKEVVSNQQTELGRLRNQQSLDDMFRASGERFSQSHGNALELRNRDYTDDKLKDVINAITTRLARMEDKLDKSIQQK